MKLALYIKALPPLCMDGVKQMKRKLKTYSSHDFEPQVIALGPKRRKLNLGCGSKFFADGFLNVDLVAKKGVNTVCDLEAPLPFQNDSVDGILLDNVLEHLKNTIGIMNECSRILTTGGLLEIIVPHAKSISAHSDPTHKKVFNEKSFDYFFNQSKPLRSSYGIDTRFKRRAFYFSDRMDGYIHIVLEKE